MIVVFIFFVILLESNVCLPMKRFSIIMLAVAVLASCSQKEAVVQLVSFTDTGCVRETKGLPEDSPRLLLMYSP